MSVVVPTMLDFGRIVLNFYYRMLWVTGVRAVAAAFPGTISPERIRASLDTPNMMMRR